MEIAGENKIDVSVKECPQCGVELIIHDQSGAHVIGGCPKCGKDFYWDVQGAGCKEDKR